MIKIIWGPAQTLGLCEIWAYEYQNFIPASTISYCIPQMNTESVDPTLYSQNNDFTVIQDY